MGRTSRFRTSASLMGRLIALVDVLAIFIAGRLCFHWYPGVEPRSGMNENMLAGNYLLLQGLACILLLVVSNQIYGLWRGGAWRAHMGRVSLSWLTTWGLILVWLVLTKSAEGFSRIWLVSWLVSGLTLLMLGRTLTYFLLKQLALHGYNQQTVLLIGDGKLNATIRQRVRHSAWTGFNIIGSLRPDNVKEIDECVRRYEPDEIWIGLELTDRATLTGILHVLRHSTANIRLIPDMFTLQVMNHGTSSIMGYSMLDISHSPMQGLNVCFKTVFDYVFAAFALVLISPLLVLIALAIKIDSPGPVIFKQKRHGWNGKIIHVYKFRSMKVHQETGLTITQATRHDPRITRIGAFLRRTSLDELPQFFNVLQGRLSVVGPRPHAVAHNEQYKELVPRYMLRHKVKPGITGWAQINGFRGETNTLDKMEKRVEHDLHYIENWSLWLDCHIIFMTIFKGFVNKNAY